MMMGEFMIFACFARSYDESHIKNGRVHLISSAVVTKILFDNVSVFESFHTPNCFNVILLDTSDFVVNAGSAAMLNGKFEVNVDVLKLIFDNLGSVGVFIAGTRIAAALVTRHPMGVLPKAGAIGGVGSGFTITYKIIQESMSPSTSSSSASLSISPNQITIKKTIGPNTTDADFLERLKVFFGINPQSLPKFSIKEEFISGILYFKSSEVEVQSKIISTLDTNNPNLRDSFIHSPLEGDQLHYLISVLSNNLYLHVIMGYLLFILLIIISCKFLFKDNIEFKKIKKYPLGD
jgi:hypothetical protein